MTLTVRDRRAVFMGAFVIGVAVAWRALLMPLASRVAESNAHADAEAQLLARELALVRDGHGLAAQLASARAALAPFASRLPNVADSAAARRDIAARVQRLAADAHIGSLRLDDAPMDPAAGAVIGARIDMRAISDAAAISRLLQGLESGDGLRIERLTLERNDSGTITLAARVQGFYGRRAP